MRRPRPLGGLLAVASAAVVVVAVFHTQTSAGQLPAGEHWIAAGRLHDAGSGVLTAALLGSALLTARRRVVASLLVAAVVADAVLLTVGPSVGGARQRVLVASAIAWQVLMLLRTQR